MRISMNRHLLLGAIAALLVPALMGAAAVATGTVSGKVTHSDGTAVPGAAVHVYHAKPKKEQKSAEPKPEKKGEGKSAAKTTTDAQGKYKLSVPAGDYTVTVKVPDVGSVKQRVTVEDGKTLIVDLKIKNQDKKDQSKK